MNCAFYRKIMMERSLSVFYSVSGCCDPVTLI